MDLIRPDSLDRLSEALGNFPDSAILAGGTDLVPLLRKGLKSPRALIDLSRVEELGRIRVRPEGLFIGAMVTLRRLTRAKLIILGCPALVEAARAVASPQIRNLGTLGGNLGQDRRCGYFNQSAFWRRSLEPCLKTGGPVCHQRPGGSACLAVYHSDLAPVLEAIGAEVELLTTEGRRMVPASEFIRDHVQANGLPGAGPELITGVLIPEPNLGAWARFGKLAVRAAIDFAAVNIGLAWLKDQDGRGRASIFVGAVGPAPIELIETQGLIGPGSRVDAEAWAQAAMEEVKAKSGLIIDTGASIKARWGGLGLVGAAVRELAGYLAAK